jgi:hypothetical protein
MGDQCEKSSAARELIWGLAIDATVPGHKAGERVGARGNDKAHRSAAHSGGRHFVTHPRSSLAGASFR